MQLHRTLMVVLAAGALAGCGGSGDKKDGTPAPTPTPTPKPKVYEPISNAAAGAVKAHMSEAELRRVAKVEPVLEQRPTKNFAGGCLYYRIAKVPLANVWRFCLGDDGVAVVLTAYSPQQPDPPKGASQGRAALIGRADSICTAEYLDLDSLTKKVAKALSEYGSGGGPAKARAVGDAIRAFIGNLEDTEEQLTAFVAPPDAKDVLDAYLETLRSQIRVLTDARTAFLAGKMDEYDRLGSEFSELGAQGKRQAREYGFATCSASTFT